MLSQPITERFLDVVTEFLALTLPGYEAEGKSRLVVGFGCTGGQHRSIAIAEALASRWRKAGERARFRVAPRAGALVSGSGGERTARARVGRSWWTRWLTPSTGPVGRSRGPRVVTIGGGTGLSVLLRGLKELTNNITAVVTVADDGGSSGRLRSELGVPPMGDIRECIVALADNETQMGRLLQYRFPSNPAADGTAPRTAATASMRSPATALATCSSRP